MRLDGARLTLATAGVAAAVLLLGRLPIGAYPRAFLAVTGALAFPIAAGAVVRWRRAWPVGPEVAVRFAAGSLLLVVVAVALNAANAFTVGRVGLVATVLTLLAVVDGGWRLRRAQAPLFGPFAAPRGSWRLWWARLVALTGTVATVGFWRSRSPLPFQTTWDGLLHMSIVNRMLEDDMFSLSLRKLSPAFSFDPYLPAFHLGLGVASRFTGVSVLNELWAGPFVLCVVAAGSLFALARVTWGSTTAAAAGAGLAGLMMTTRKSTNPLLNILPASEVVAFAPLVLLLLADPDRKRALRRGSVVAVLMMGVHGLLGILLLGAVFMCWLVDAVWRRFPRAHKVIGAVLIVVGTVVAVAFAVAGPLRFVTPSWALDPTSFYSSLTPAVGTRLRLYLLASSYPPVVPGFLAAAATAAFLTSRRSAEPGMLVAFPGIVLIGFAIPVVGLERLEGFLWIASSLTLAWCFRELQRLVTRQRDAHRAPRWSALVVGVVAIALVPLMIQPLASFRAYQEVDTSEHHLQSSFSGYELTGIRHYAATHGRSLPFVSDPMTQQIGEGLGRFDSIGGMSTPPDVQLQLASLFHASTPGAARQYLTALQARTGPFVLAVTARSERWAILHFRGLWDGKSPEDLRFSAVFRPWDFSALPDTGNTPATSVVTKTKAQLLRPLRRSGCMTSEVNHPEIVFFTVDCNAGLLPRPYLAHLHHRAH